ncbi:hypothetical protein GR255_10450 [Mycobacterium tuberculosis]|nr:hypothetical protein [Mycobacterium tuberculosis]
MEAALAIATLVLVLVLCLAGVTAVSMQVRCIDAAREAARLAARGDVRSATDVARSIAPRAALVQVHRDGEFVVATVTAHSNLLPTLDIATRVWSTSRGTRPPSRPGALRRLSERAIVTTLLMPAPLDVDDEIGGVVRRALPIPYVGGSRIQPSSVQSA